MTLTKPNYDLGGLLKACVKPVIGTHRGGSLLPGSLPGFAPIPYDLSWPGRHPPNFR